MGYCPYICVVCGEIEDNGWCNDLYHYSDIWHDAKCSKIPCKVEDCDEDQYDDDNFVSKDVCFTCIGVVNSIKTYIDKQQYDRIRRLVNFKLSVEMIFNMLLLKDYIIDYTELDYTIFDLSNKSIFNIVPHSYVDYNFGNLISEFSENPEINNKLKELYMRKKYKKLLGMNKEHGFNVKHHPKYLIVSDLSVLKSSYFYCDYWKKRVKEKEKIKRQMRLENDRKDFEENRIKQMQLIENCKN